MIANEVNIADEEIEVTQSDILRNLLEKVQGFITDSANAAKATVTETIKLFRTVVDPATTYLRIECGMHSKLFNII